MAIKLLKLFKRKPMAEKKILEEIKLKKNADKKKNQGGPWVSCVDGCYRVSHKKKGKVMEVSNLEKVKDMTTNAAEFIPLLKKIIRNSSALGCEMIVMKTWIFAKYPRLKKFGFKEIKKGSEKELLEIINKKKISEDKLLEFKDKIWFPTYYYKFK